MMSKKTFFIPMALGLLGCLLSLSGCALLQSLLGTSNTPTAEVTGVHITDFSLTEMTLNFDVAVKNPYSVALPLVNIDYSLASQSQPFLKGQAALQGSIPAGQSKTISLPTKVVFLELLKVLPGIKPGAQIPYQTTLGLSVNAPVVGALRLPIAKEGQLPIPTAPDVSVTSLTWKDVSLSGASGLVKIKLGNRNSFAFDVAGFEYAFKVAGMDLAKGALTNAASLAPGAAQELGIGVSVSAAQAGLALIQLAQGQGGNYSLGGALSIGTPFGPLRIPLDLKGNVPFLH
jgi:LEA14-like dessication related protein